MATPEPPETISNEESAIDALHSIAGSLEVIMSVALAMLPQATRDKAQRILQELRGDEL